MRPQIRLPLSLCLCLTFIHVPASADTPPADPLIIQSDSGARAGHINFEALPSSTGRNTLKKSFHVESLEHVQSAELLLFAALRDLTDQPSFAFATWEWVFFNLNGHQWVRRVEDLPLHRKSLFEVNWDDVHWAAIAVPDPAYLRPGRNELVIWNNNLPENRKDKYLVVAYDDSGNSTASFSKIGDEWSADDLNGDRDGAPRGEWMIRLKLNRLGPARQKIVDALGPARYRQAVEDKKAYVWGLTDAASWVFPDRPYAGPLENQWTIDAARNEYESCQLVLVPVSADLLMTRIITADLTAQSGATIARDAITVRLVRTARAEGVDWPDPLPPAYPIDVRRGSVQSFWITVHVPENAQPGLYRSQLTIATMSTGGRDGHVVKLPLQLRVRSFALPTISRYQTISPARESMRAYHMVNCTNLRPVPNVRSYLDKDENLRVDFTSFDKAFQAALDDGVRNFSIGLAYTGANSFTPECFDWWVDVEGQDQRRRIWVCPVNPNEPDADTQENRNARKWFTQYLTQIYEHVEKRDWTQYCWVYGADEPLNSQWTDRLQRYFKLIKQNAPNLRIMITYGPTDRFGPNVDIACIMMNHLRQDTAQAAAQLNQELWSYSCGNLNNPALTLNQTPIGIRLWFWLQQKWNVKRVLLWHTAVYGRTFHHPGVDGRGDGQVFYTTLGPDGSQDQVFPSIRAEMLRDGVEDREYFYLLRKLTEQFAAAAESDEDEALLARARELCQVPQQLVRTQFDMSRDVNALLARRAAMADMIEQLQQGTE